LHFLVPGIKPKPPVLQEDSLPAEPPGKHSIIKMFKFFPLKKKIKKAMHAHCGKKQKQNTQWI